MNKVEIFNFVMNEGGQGRRMLGFKVKDKFGDAGYRYYQDVLWGERHLRSNVWGCVEPTRKGYALERELKGWDQTSEVKTQ